MKKLQYILILILITFRIYPVTDIYWEKEDILTAGNIGHFDIFNNNKMMGIIYSNLDDNFSISVKYTNDGYNWSDNKLLVKKFFSNNPLGVDFGVDIDKDNNLYVVYRENKKKLTLNMYPYPYTPGNFNKIVSIESDNIIYLPKILISDNNLIHMIYSSNKDNRFIIAYSKISTDGKIISESIIGENYISCLNPVIKEYNNEIFIAFQSKDQNIEGGYFYNISIARSTDMGNKWNNDIIISSTGENNQRPYFIFDKDIIHLTWEKEDKNFISHIYYTNFNFHDISTAAENQVLISSNDSEAHSPVILNYNQVINIFWYDNLKGSFQNYYAQILNNEILESDILITKKGRTLRNNPILFNNSLKYFWLQSETNNTIYSLKTDTYTASPKISFYDNNTYVYTNKTDIKLKWNRVNDTSGIKGYQALLTKNKDEEISEDSQLIFYNENSIEYNGLTEGTWYFKLLALDNAGNKSETSVFSFTIDTIPPYPPEITAPEIDSDGTLSNNSPIIEWIDSNEKLKIYRYHYKFFINSNEDRINRYQASVNERNFKYTTEKYLNLKNLDNGTLLFGIMAYDKAGNPSEITWRRYILDDYIPSTYISYIDSKILQNGETVLQIYGRGFKANGDITEIYIDKDKKLPYDYIIHDNNFKVDTDRFIRQLREVEIDDGAYFIGVNHPVRGIKFNNSRSGFSGEWTFRQSDENLISLNKIVYISEKYNLTVIIFITIGIFWGLIILLIVLSIYNAVREKRNLKKLISELEIIKKELEQPDYLERRKAMKRKGMSLTIKYSILILLLVFTIVIATSVTLSALALRNETRNLANEMEERAELIMENYRVTMTEILTFEDINSIRSIDAARNVSKLPDIGFVMFRLYKSDGLDITYIEGNEIPIFFKGTSLDELTLEDREKMITEMVFSPDLAETIEQFKESYDKNNYNIQSKITPEFEPANINDRYVFVKPIFNELNGQYMAEIIIGYSFEKIIKLISTERWVLIRIAAFVILIAILISIIGAVFLATTTIQPIKKMSQHVNVISSTEDYEQLLGTDNEKIIVKSGDEIGLLASSINDMTSKLIEKAKADKQMMLGKEIQKKFIPLEPHETDYIDIFGFYEGAKGVSGDYFDYKKLDDQHYAFIICDVAGKAVPAALIMVQISTIFHSYFTNFDPKKDRLETVSIVTMINDTVAERGFQGRFAAILISILNVRTGRVLMTNAGYTQLLVYRDKLEKAEWITLNDAGAAGVFPSYMLPTPYEQEGMILNKGDILYLFTDGIEESRNGQTIKNENGEEQPEEFGLVRIKQIMDNSKGKKPKDVIEILVDEEKIFRGDLEQYDDLTILGIKRK